MTIFLTIVYVIAGIISLFLIIAAFTKRDFNVTRTVNIAKPKDTVFDYIKYLKNQNSYSKWKLMDPNMKQSFTGTDAAPGFISAWEGNDKVGKGEQEIKAIKDGERVDYELRFEKPFKSVASSYMATASAGNDTKVDWNVSGKMNYPMNGMMLFMNMDKRMGDDLMIGLTNLKTKMEG